MSDDAPRASFKAELAAFCARGVEAALSDWARALERFGPEAGVRAAHAAARSVLPVWEARPDRGVEYVGDVSPGERVAAVLEWLDCPCDEHVRAALDTLPLSPQPTMVQLHGDEGWANAHDAAELLVLSVKRPRFVASTLALAARASGSERSVVETAAAALAAWARA